MKNIRVVLSENYQFLEVKFSIYLNRSVFVMPYLRRQKIPQTLFAHDVSHVYSKISPF